MYSRYSYITRSNLNSIEFKTNNSLIYFLNPLITEVYGIKNKEE